MMEARRPKREWVPRITVELPPDLVRWLQLLPYGTKKHLLTAMLQDLKDLCEGNSHMLTVLLAGIMEGEMKAREWCATLKEAQDAAERLKEIGKRDDGRGAECSNNADSRISKGPEKEPF